METEQRKFGYEVKDIDRLKGQVTLYANAFDVLDTDNDISLPGSFKKTIKENFHRLKWFLNHDRTQLLGVPIKAWEDKTGPLVTGQLNMKKKISIDTLEDYILYNENGKSLEHSAGLRAIKYEIFEGENVPKEYKKQGVEWMRVVSEWKWWEYSTLTSWGANEHTPLVSVKSLSDINDTINWLHMMQKRNYTDERQKNIELTIKTLQSLITEPEAYAQTTQKNEPIDINKLMSNYKLFH